MHVRGVERIQRAERIAPPGRKVAVRHAHLVGIAEPEREFVQPLAETDALDIGDLPAVPFDLVEVGDHAVRIVPAGRHRQLTGVIPPLEIERQRRREPYGVVFVGTGTLLVNGVARLRIVRHQRIEELVAAVRRIQVEVHAQPEVTYPEVEERTLVAVPAVGGIGLGIRQQVLRQERNAQIEVDIMLVHGIEGIERHGHPAVYVHQVGHLAVAPGAERAALAQRIGPGEPHRVEVHDVPALAFGVHDVERQLRGGDRDQHTVSDPLCGDAVTPAVIRGQQHPSSVRGIVPRRRGKRTEGRRGDAVFAAGHQVVAVGFVPAR